MNRRKFLAATAAFGVGAAAPINSSANTTSTKRHNFKLKYAPHFNMFRNSAGNDLIDQLKFAADQGFTAWEDNGMKKRPVDLQSKIGKTMEQLGMQMGVFVAHGSIGRLNLRAEEIRPFGIPS